jgi:hypothetical protein
MDMQQLIDRLLTGQEEMKAKIKADLKTLQEMKERGEAEGKSYMEMLAKWKGYRKEVATRREAIHDKIYDKLRADWVKLAADFKKKEGRHAESLRGEEDGRAKSWPRKEAERKACEKMMAERKADQEEGRLKEKPTRRR